MEIKTRKTLKILTKKILYIKYAEMQIEYNKMCIENLLFFKKTHFLSIYKDILIFNFTDEFLKRFYYIKEPYQKIPRIAKYYQNYLLFFCRPYFKNIFLLNLMQSYYDSKAEIFYRENYSHEPQKKKEILNHNNKNNDDNKHQHYKKISLNKKSKNDKEQSDNNIIFDSTARKFIDENNLLTTIDLCSSYSHNGDIFNYDDNYLPTTKTQNDALVDMINCMNNKQKICKNKEKKDKTTTSSFDEKNKIHSNSKRDVFKKTKSSLCNLYKKTKIILNDYIPSHVNYLHRTNLPSPKMYYKSNIVQFQKSFPKSKQQKSFGLKQNITDVVKSNKNSFKNSINNFSLNNNKSKYTHKSLINKIKNNSNNNKKNLEFKGAQNNKIAKGVSKTNRNKMSFSPNNNLIKTYLTNYLSPHSFNNNSHFLNNNINQQKKNSSNTKKKQFYVNRNNNSNVDKIKIKNIPMNLYSSNKAQKKTKTSKNSGNISRAMIDTLFKKEGNLITTSNHKKSGNRTMSNKKELNVNLNVNLNHINININTNDHAVYSHNSSFIYRNKSNSSSKKGSLSLANSKDKNIPPEMKKIINQIKNNINSNRMINDFICSNKNKELIYFDKSDKVNQNNEGKKTKHGRKNSSRSKIQIKNKENLKESPKKKLFSGGQYTNKAV